MHGEKYMKVRYDGESGFITLKSSTGGATIAKTKTAVVIAIWDKSETMSNGKI